MVITRNYWNRSFFCHGEFSPIYADDCRFVAGSSAKQKEPSPITISLKKSKDYCPPTQSNLDRHKLGYNVLQPIHAVQSARELSFFQIFNDYLPYSILADVRIGSLPSEVTGDDCVATAAERFRCCLPLETQRGDYFWGRLEYFPALHENVHTSEKFRITLVLHLHRLHQPIQQFLLQFYRL